MGTVVGAAILRDGRVLAARRTSPPELAGRWEFPGGKVEPGESPTAALERELREELGCAVRVTGWLAGTTPIGTTHELSVATVALLDGEPAPTEHDVVRWLGADELDDVDWLEPDLPFLPELRSLLRAV
ncbi:(deoxy)nucleoside triphosphate pyrophosphohydrolase [Nocardioides sp.]|uniref:(deoxy)nucleoside triphosphate pyrophosphohydrolase n=1 Tax=Nocardioides sp. TaxID=35761 RepID=UPI0031FEE668|nr:(deoxy)nucleoside triphosphate pyrophosphohydrolase [Nocardioides sp.]